jgi:hypothetical protein
MGNEGDFKINITGDASSLVAASQQTNQALESNKIKLIELTPEQKALTQAQTKTSEVTKEASTVAEKHTGHLQGMHRAFHALNEVVPGLGVLMQAAFSPVGAAISIGIMALRGFKEHLKAVSEELDKMAEANAKPLTNRLEIMRDSVIRNEASMVEFGLRISDAALSEHELSKSIDEVISRMHKQAEEVKALGEIRGKSELTILENLHQAGLMSEQDYARRRFEIEEELAKKKRKLAEGDLQAEINVRKAGMDAAKDSDPALTTKAERAGEESVRARTEAMVARSGMDTGKENLAQAKEALTKWEKEHADWSLKGALHAAMFGGNGAEEAKKDIAEHKRLADAVASADRAVKQAPGDVARKENLSAVAEDERKRSSEAAVENTKLITKSKEEIDRKERELAALKQSNKELSSAEHDEKQLGRPAGALATQDMAAAVATALKFVDTPAMYQARNPGVTEENARRSVNQERHTAVAPDEQQRMTDLATRITGHQTGLAEALTVLGKAAQDTGAFANDVGRLVTVMENLSRNISSIRGHVDQLAAQVRELQGRPPAI